MASLQAKDLMKGEMFSDGFDGMMLHGPYWKVIDHRHEEERVIVKDIRTGCMSEYSYYAYVMTRPFAYKHIRDELRPDWVYYKEWPYDEEGVFCDPPRDYSNWVKE